MTSGTFMPKVLDESGTELSANVVTIEPFGYLAMAAVLGRCERVLTDSGGLQKEAYWARRPCITLRDEAEWVETCEGLANQVVGADKEAILSALEKSSRASFRDGLYGDGTAAERCVAAVMSL